MGYTIPLSEFTRAARGRLKRQLVEHGRLVKFYGDRGEQELYAQALLEAGRMIHDESVKLYHVAEIPPPGRSCPWAHVIAKLIEDFPNNNFEYEILMGCVSDYLRSCAQCEGFSDPNYSKHAATEAMLGRRPGRRG